MPARDRHLTTLTAVALVVLLGDLATKELAVALFADGGASLGAFGQLLGERVRLTVVANSQSAFGIPLGRHTWAINVALTLGAILLILPVCRELARLDPRAPRALGLIAGAAGGNLVSLLVSPAGVPDFIAIEHAGGRELVLNVADVAAYAGLVLMVPLGLAVLRQVREARAEAARVTRTRRPRR